MPAHTRRACRALLYSAKPRSQPAVLASVCCLLAKNIGPIQGSVRGEYRLRTDLGALRHDVACLVHKDLSLRSGCVRATDSPSTPDVLALYVHERITHMPPRVFKKIQLSLAQRAAHVKSASPVRGPCVVYADLALPQFNLSRTLRLL